MITLIKLDERIGRLNGRLVCYAEVIDGERKTLNIVEKQISDLLSDIEKIREALNLPNDASVDEIVYRIQELMQLVED